MAKMQYTGTRPLCVLVHGRCVLVSIISLRFTKRSINKKLDLRNDAICEFNVNIAGREYV